MSSRGFLEKGKKRLAGIYEQDSEKIDRLRSILEAQQKRKVTLEEAEETGKELIQFYKLLAGNKKLVPGFSANDEVIKHDSDI